MTEFDRRLYDAKKIDNKNLYVADVKRAGVRVYWSYETPIAFNDMENGKLHVTGGKYSKTTSRHKTYILNRESRLSNALIEYRGVDEFLKNLRDILEREIVYTGYNSERGWW